MIYNIVAMQMLMSYWKTMSSRTCRPVLPKGSPHGYRTILPKPIPTDRTVESEMFSSESVLGCPHLASFEGSTASCTPVMSNLSVPANPLPPPGHNDEFKTAEIDFCAQLGSLPEYEVVSPAKAAVPTSRHSSPRSIYWWERTVTRLRSQVDTLNQRLLTQDALVFQWNAEWIQLCEENRTLRTDVKALRNARDLLLQEVSLELLRLDRMLMQHSERIGP